MSAGVLVVAESRQGELREVSRELLSLGAELAGASGGGLSVAVIGSGAERFAAELQAPGVTEVLTVSAPTEHFEAHVWERAVEGLIESEDPAVILCGHTIDSLGFAPALAARLGLGFATDVTSVSWSEVGPRVHRGAYGDKLSAQLAFGGKKHTLLTVRPGIFAPAEPGDGSAAVRAVEVDLSGTARTEHLGFVEAAASGVDITKAEFLLSIGRGIEDKDNIPRFQELADRLGATLSSSRPLVDAGWMDSSRQVGQSGKTVKPRLYLAMGISGAVQHLAGMRGADTIIAVNSDPEAPIFGVAHFGAVADMFEVADELEDALG
ncbi:MAG TPA: electron transfer flavoprotein subunit alpha/FixB family protein [Solirubrobacteraceae bacterium]|nr:electron transfer flavoprotein subunit alpha/FixB family protein [Solirubrobacteraceae bacterium]